MRFIIFRICRGHIYEVPWILAHHIIIAWDYTGEESVFKLYKIKTKSKNHEICRCVLLLHVGAEVKKLESLEQVVTSNVSLPGAVFTLGKVFAGCPIKSSRQRNLCRPIFCRRVFARCYSRQRLCRVWSSLCREYSASGKTSESCSVGAKIFWHRVLERDDRIPSSSHA